MVSKAELASSVDRLHGEVRCLRAEFAEKVRLSETDDYQELQGLQLQRGWALFVIISALLLSLALLALVAFWIYGAVDIQAVESTIRSDPTLSDAEFAQAVERVKTLSELHEARVFSFANKLLGLVTPVAVGFAAYALGRKHSSS